MANVEHGSIEIDTPAAAEAAATAAVTSCWPKPSIGTRKEGRRRQWEVQVQRALPLPSNIHKRPADRRSVPFFYIFTSAKQNPEKKSSSRPQPQLLGPPSRGPRMVLMMAVVSAGHRPPVQGERCVIDLTERQAQTAHQFGPASTADL